MAAFSCYNNVINGHGSLSSVPNQPISKFTVRADNDATSYHHHIINSLSDQGDDCYSSLLTSTTSKYSSMEITHKMQAGTKKKRKISDSKVGKDGSKEKKQKRCQRGRMSKSSTGETMKDVESKGKKKVDEVAGWVHVRARRGQATDSHSLAERVRREQIGQRMRFLQSLVPGCEKIKGKVLVLDEIISYIQSLQNLVEFLAEKYASSYTMLNDLEILDLELSMLSAQGNFACFDEDPLFSANIQSDQYFQLAEEPPTFPATLRNYAGTDWQYLQE